MGIYGEDYQPHVWCRISEPTTVVSKRLGSPPLRKAMKGRSRGSHNLILFDLLTGMILQGFSMTPKLPDWMESPRNICLNIWGVAPNRSLWWRDSRWNIYHFSGTASIYGDFQQMTWLDAQTIPKPINWVYPTMISCFHGIRVFGIHEMLTLHGPYETNITLDGKLTETQMIFFSFLGTPPKMNTKSWRFGSDENHFPLNNCVIFTRSAPKKVINEVYHPL